jgi:Ca-activated chloride channel family protein
MLAALSAALMSAAPLVAENSAPAKSPVENKTEKQEKKRESRNKNLSIVIDRSASLGVRSFESGKERAIKTVEALDAADFVSLVAFGEQVEVLASSRLATEEVKKDVIEKIKSVKMDKKAAMFAGISKSADELRKNLDKKYENKIEVFSSQDRGMNIVGPSSDDELSRLVNSLKKEKIKVAGTLRFKKARDARRNVKDSASAKTPAKKLPTPQK